MSNTSKPETVTIVLNGREVQADPSKPLIKACHDAGESVPHYCYHPGLSTVGSCRMCQVQVKQGEAPPRVMASCRTPVAPGMIVETQAEPAREARRMCLEFLLKNHPLDCPICDKAGECSLQDYSFSEGQHTSRSAEPKAHFAKRKDLGEKIVLDRERCVVCSRCVRFFEEVTEAPQLCISQRAAHSEVATFNDQPLTGNYQGNIVDICPVGALTLKDFRFQARVWNLTKVASTCGECSRGCATSVEVLRRKQVKRVRPIYDEAVNGHWICDKGRLAIDTLNPADRLAGAQVRSGQGDWQAVDVHAALEIVANGISATAGDAGQASDEQVLVLASPFLSQEEAGALKELAKSYGATLAFISPEPDGLADDLLHTGDPCPNRKGLEQLGYKSMNATEALAALGAAERSIIIGERAAEFLGAGLSALPSTARLFLFDCVQRDYPTAAAMIGIPSIVEKQGTWINVDGLERKVAIARTAPSDVWQLERTIETLQKLHTALIAPAPSGVESSGLGEGAPTR